MTGLTKRQFDVLSFIGAFIAERGYSPSFEEIGNGLGLTSQATVHKHVGNLTKKGLLIRDYNQSRSIALTLAGSRQLKRTPKSTQKVSCPQCKHEFEVGA